MNDSDDKPMIHMPDMCERHRGLLVHQAQYSRQDSWQALIVVAQISLFQCATCDPKTHELTGGDITTISKLGCLACYKPDAFGDVVEAAKSHDLSKVKAVGEAWIERHQNKEKQ